MCNLFEVLVMKLIMMAIKYYRTHVNIMCIMLYITKNKFTYERARCKIQIL